MKMSKKTWILLGIAAALGFWYWKKKRGDADSERQRVQRVDREQL